MEYSLLNHIGFFIIYSFLGWWLEVTFQTVTTGKFVNRGFLNGPVCPIYGFGMITLLFFLSPVGHNMILLFIGAVILTSALEFLTGYLLEKLFDDKWWDYSELPFNLHGYICLSFSLMWGLAAVFVMNIIHPIVVKFSSIFDNQLGHFFLLVLLIYFIADFIVTLTSVLKLQKRFTLLNEMADRLQLYSDEIGVDIYQKTNFIIESANKVINEVEESKTDTSDLNIPEIKDKRNKLTAKKDFVQKRIENAYPNLKDKLRNFGDEYNY